MAAEPERRTAAGQHGFTIVLRGYRPAEVDHALAALHARLERLAADRSTLAEQKDQVSSRLLGAIRQIDELGTQVKHLSASAGSADGLSERIRVILELASAEATTMTAHARQLLDQNKRTQADLDRGRSQLETERRQMLASARAEADQLRGQAQEAAKAHRAETVAEAERILSEARTNAKAIVEQAHRTATADAERLRKHLHTQLPQSLNTVIDTALGQLAGPAETSSDTTEQTEDVVIPQQRQPQADAMAEEHS